jgi:hypothetical protein
MTTEVAPWPEVLRISNCPECRYSLRGQREWGRCLECGWKYRPE